MPTHDEDRAVDEADRGVANVRTQSTVRHCRYCNSDLPPASPRARIARQFCSPAHRAAWRRQEQRLVLGRLRGVMDDLGRLFRL